MPNIFSSPEGPAGNLLKAYNQTNSVGPSGLMIFLSVFPRVSACAAGGAPVAKICRLFEASPTVALLLVFWKGMNKFPETRGILRSDRGGRTRRGIAWFGATLSVAP